MTPKSSWPRVKTLLHSVFDRSEKEAVHAQANRIPDALWEELPTSAEHLERAQEEILAFNAFRKEVWRQLYSHNTGARLY